MIRVEDVLDLFRANGDSQYGGEAVSQAEHALQCALLAETLKASPALIVAALLHDIGHLLHDLPDEAPDSGVDDRHEELACHYLGRLFPENVTEPIRLHVPAKRYLCATDPDYQAKLSEPSLISLELQGGAMTRQEVAAFEENPFSEDAVRLRRWDDAAKTPGLETPPLSHFEDYLNGVALD